MYVGIVLLLTAPEKARSNNFVGRILTTHSSIDRLVDWLID